MKTKQNHLTAKFTGKAPVSNAVNYSGKKELINSYSVIDKKTEREIVDCRVYMARGASASTVYASVWVNGVKGAPVPAGWEYLSTAGRGTAGGGGYHKSSAAVGNAITSAGITLYGTPYENGEKPDMKRVAYIAGVGESAIRAALLAIAYACGCKDAIFV